MWSKSLGFSSVANSSELSASMSYYISGRASMDGPLNNVLSSPVSLSDSLLLHLIVLSYFYFLAPSLQFNRKWSWSVFLKEAFTLSSFFSLCWIREISISTEFLLLKISPSNSNLQVTTKLILSFLHYFSVKSMYKITA